MTSNLFLTFNSLLKKDGLLVLIRIYTHFAHKATDLSV